MIIKTAGIQKQSIVDGVGLRYVVFAQGCSHNCAGCHNPESHAFGIGKDYMIEDIIMEIKKNPLLKGATFSGGEPFEQAKSFVNLAKHIKDMNLDIWCYTGFIYEDLLDSKDIYKLELLQYIDVLVDGKFEIENRSLAAPYKGSSNQRIIDVRKSSKNFIKEIAFRIS